MNYYPHLFQEGKLGKVTVKNRIVMSPMGDNMANSDGSVSDQAIAYYTERAKGGAGVLIAGVFSVDYPGGKTTTSQHRIDQVKYIKNLERLTRSVHRYGALFIPQIHHAGMSTDLLTTEGITPVCVSAMEQSGDKIGVRTDEEIAQHDETPQLKELTTKDVKALVQKYVNAALYSKRANCDGVEVHGAHGYLIAQFLTPFTNRRQDEYGGNLENRMRFPLEIIRGIRAACGPEFIVGIRMPVHKWPSDGLTDEESQTMAKAFEAAGCDFLDASGGFPPLLSALLETQSYPQGARVDLAEKIKKVVKIPVFAVGNLREPDFCEKVIADGKADFVALGRTLLCDPYWPEKARAGKADEIRKCISCLDGCFGSLGTLQSVRCVINPLVGYENEFAMVRKTDAPKNVVVIGGGPGGMQAAVTAAEIGHRVTLLEKSAKLGGQLNLASVPPHKDVINWVTQWYGGEMNRQGVDIKLGRHADAAYIKSLKPDVVIAATGATPWAPPIPGIENGVQSWSLLDGTARIPENKKVAIIGGGIVGCEVALLLKEKGNDVTILEMLPDVALSLESANRDDLMCEFKECSVNTILGATVKTIDAQGIVFVKNGKEDRFEADVIVLSIGQKPFGTELISQLKNEGLNVVAVGDVRKPAKIIDATTQGFFAALNV